MNNSFSMTSSEPYSIIDVITNKTVKQMINLEACIAEVWERKGRGENVRMVGDVHTVLEKRAWGE